MINSQNKIQKSVVIMYTRLPSSVNHFHVIFYVKYYYLDLQPQTQLETDMTFTHNHSPYTIVHVPIERGRKANDAWKKHEYRCKHISLVYLQVLKY